MNAHSWESGSAGSEPPEVRRGEANRLEKKKRILTSAARIFAHKGFLSARISDIARDAGVADGTVYLYFQGKDDLLGSIFQETMEKFLTDGKRIMAEHDDPVERIRRLIHLHVSLLGGDPDLAAVFQIELRGSRKSLSVLSHDRLSEYFDLLAQNVELGQELGMFRRELRPKMVARILWGAVDEVVTHWVLANKPSDLLAAGATAVEIILRGIQAAPGAAR